MAKNLKDIADQYAKAIFELSSEQNNIEETRTSLNGIKTVLNDNPNFVMVVTSDDVDPASRDNLLQTLTNGASESIQNLVDAFGDRYNEANGIVDVTATTAVTLDETRLDKLAAIFASKTGAKHVNLKNVVDESILGGVILKSQSTLIDGSLQTKIAKMKAQLLG